MFSSAAYAESMNGLSPGAAENANAAYINTFLRSIFYHVKTRLVITVFVSTEHSLERCLVRKDA